RVWVAETADGARVEFVESVQPPLTRDEKWVLIVSTLKGCPVRCAFCDAGGDYRGRLSVEEILAQADFMLRRRYPDGRVPVPKLKVQLARMGDPALNDAVLAVLAELPRRWEAPGLVPCLSTIAPAGRERFFAGLLDLRRTIYAGRPFQLQFSLHGTDAATRRRLVPARTWSLAAVAAYGDRFFEPGGTKIGLNFAPARGLPLEPERLCEHFSPERFLVKLTPINPTRARDRAGLAGVVDADDPGPGERLAARFAALGYETILSIGDLRENAIGSNCGMYVSRADASALASRGGA
ncbi:MAG: radical SAM protein, partial [Candidatus Krumholzibacteriota bacterium]|nr:radical SAM protein [Candidatus Krumholzibacteriota bacterium]